MRGFWRHEACLDLYGHMATKYVGPRYRKVRAVWYVRGYPLGLAQNIVITNEDFARWKPCTREGLYLTSPAPMASSHNATRTHRTQ